MIKGFKYFLILAAALCAAFFARILFVPGTIAGNFGDVYLHYYPLKHLAAERLIAGEIPLWNPYIFAGQPLQANPQSALFYPLSVIFCLFPLSAAFNWFEALHVFAACVFFFLLLKNMGYSNTGGIFGSLAFAFSSYIVYNIPAGHPVMLSGFAWTPLVILFMQRLSAKASGLTLLAFSLTLSFQFLSGHFLPVFASAVFMLILSAAKKFSNWKNAALAGTAALLLSSIQFIPTLQLSQALEKSFWAGMVRYYALSPKNLATLALPDFFGNVVDGTFVQGDLYSYFFEKHNLYFGLIPLAFAFIGAYFSIRKREYTGIILVGAGLLLASGVYTYSEQLYSGIPGLNLLRVPARFYLLSLVGFIILACSAWDSLKPLIRAKAVWMLLLALTAFDLFWWHSKFIYPQDIAGYEKRSELSGEILPFYRIATESGTLPSNKAMMFHQYNVNGYEAVFLRKYVHYMGFQQAQIMGSTGLARIDFLSPLTKGLSTAYFISTKPLPGMKAKLSLSNGVTLYTPKDPLPRVFFARELLLSPNYEKYVEYTPEQRDFMSGTKASPDKVLLVNELPTGYKHAYGRGRILSYSSEPSRLSAEVAAPDGGALVFSEMYYPGWSAWAGGKKQVVGPGNISLRTVFLPPGNYTGRDRLIMYFHPASWSLGLYMTLFSLILIAVFFIFPGFLTKLVNIDMINKP